MSVKKRNGKWHYRFNLGGKIHSGSTGLPATPANLKRAEEQEALARAKARSGQISPQAVAFERAMPVFLAAVAHDLKPSSHRRVSISMVSLGEWFGSTPLREIQPGQIEGFKAWRRKEGREEVTIRKDLHALSKLFQYARLMRWMTHDPLDGVTMPSDGESVRERVLQPAEERAYFAAAAELKRSALPDVAKLILLTGLRTCEAYRLEWRDVDLEGGTLRVRESKSKAGRRTLTLVDEAKTLLARRLAARRMDRPAVFVFESPKRPGHPLERLTVSHKSLCEDGGLKDLQLRDFRRTFGTRMAAAGCPPHVLMKIMGHSDIKVTMRHYVHAQSEERDLAFRLFESTLPKEKKQLQ